MTNSNINTNTYTNLTSKSLVLPYIHSIIIPLIIYAIFENPLLAVAYLSIPTVVYLTVRKDKYMNFIIPAIIMAALLVAGWADAVPMP